MSTLAVTFRFGRLCRYSAIQCHNYDKIFLYQEVASHVPPNVRNTTSNTRSSSDASDRQTTEKTPTSARREFKSLPVNHSILRYIQNVGVGIPSKSSRRHKKKRKTTTLPGGVGSRGKGNNDMFVMSSEEERERLVRTRRTTTEIPPPPFAIPTGVSTSQRQGKEDRPQAQQSTRHIPVKLIGRVGTSDEEFPRETKGMPEIAIAGRSNVGKSTLLNALLYGGRQVADDDDNDENEKSTLTQRRLRRQRRGPSSWTSRLPKGLKAATSCKPGETRHVSFYQLSARVDSKKLSLMLVDLPGYGFAFASDNQAREWQSLMESYILGRGNALKRLLLLIDSRHGMKKADIEFLETLQQSMDKFGKDDSGKKRTLPPIQIVLTKCDLVPQQDLARRVVLVKQQLSDCLEREPSSLPIMFVSAQMEGQAGVIHLQKELASLVVARATDTS